MNGQLSLDMVARDLVSPVIANIRNGLGGLRREADGTKSIFNSFFEGVGVGVGFRAIDLAISKVGDLKNALLDAAQLQTSAIATSSDIARNLAVPMIQAKEVLRSTQEQLADIAAALPGETRNYQPILESISPTIANLNKGNVEGYQQQVLDITKRAGVLAAIRPGISPEMAGSALSRGLSGTMGLGELFSNDLFQKNPELMNSMRAKLKAIGKEADDWKTLSDQTRVKIIQESLALVTPDSLLKEFEGTPDAILQGWKTNLFDPLKGLFGMMRRLASKENRSVLDAFQGSLQGLDATFKELSRFTGGVDPLTMVIDFFDWVADKANAVALFLQGGSKLDVGSLYRGLVQFTQWFPKWLANSLSKVDGIAVGRMVGSLLSGLAGLFSSIDWSSWLRVLYEVIRLLVSGLTGIFLEMLRSLGEQVVGVWNGFVDGVVGLIRQLTDALARVPVIGGLFKGSEGQVQSESNPLAGFLSPNTQQLSPGLELAKPMSQQGAFAPSVTINASTNASPQDMADALGNELARRYNMFASGRMA